MIIVDGKLYSEHFLMKFACAMKFLETSSEDLIIFKNNLVLNKLDILVL